MKYPIFSFRRIWKNYELIPITAFVAVDLIGGLLYGLYLLHSRPDVRILKSREERFKKINMDEPQTLRLLQKRKYEHNYPKEMDDLRKEIWKEYRA